MKILILTTHLLLSLALNSSILATSLDRRVQVRNGSEKKITKVLVSSDGETFAPAELPSSGIKPGQTKQVGWERDPSVCQWHVKAQYADRSESAAVRVDACSNDTTVGLN